MKFTDRITIIERRLDRLESAVGLASERPVFEPRQRRVAPPPVPTPGPVDEIPPSPVTAVLPAEPDPFLDPPVFDIKERDPSFVAPPRMPRPVQRGNLEQTIGLKWTGWVGALVFVIGSGFLISWLYTSGYFALIPPAGRVSLMAMLGFALIGAGEYVLRKFDPRAAVGLFGAGVAVLLLVGYAGHAFYNLYGQDTAYIAMTAATVIGAFAAGRGKMVSIGALSIIGGALAPALLHEGVARPAGFFAYLGTLQIVALVLTYRSGNPKWWVLRVVSLTVSALWVLATLHQAEFARSMVPTFFCLLSAAGYQLEVLAAARRRPADVASASNGVVFNLIATGLLTVALLSFPADDAIGSRVAWIAFLAVATGLMSIVCRRFASLKLQSTGYLIQSIALVATLAPVGFSGDWVALGWLGWAIALAVAGRRFNGPIVRALAACVWLIAVLDLGLFSAGFVGLQAQHFNVVIATEGIPIAGIVGLLMAVGGIVISTLDDGEMPSTGVAVVSLLLWIVSACNGLDSAVATVTVAAFAWLLAAVGAYTGRRFFMGLVAATLAVAISKWIGFDLLAARIGGALPAYSSAALISPSMIEAMCLSASVGGIYLMRRPAIDRLLLPSSAAVNAIIVSGLVTLMMTVAGSVEIDRWVARLAPHAVSGFGPGQWEQLLFTGFWTIALAGFAIGALAIGPQTPGRSARVLKFCRVTLTLMTFKFLLIDTVLIPFDGGRGAGTLILNPRAGVAGILIVAGFVFQRRAKHFLGEIDGSYLNWNLTMQMLTAVWAGTLELNHGGIGWGTDTAHVATSVFWAASAVLAIAAGFVRHRAAARYFGLTLLAITVGKVLFVDLANVQTGWRILSFMALGGLLLLTSVLYGKVSPARRIFVDSDVRDFDQTVES